jgi:hypothetical protein
MNWVIVVVLLSIGFIITTMALKIRHPFRLYNLYQ